MKDTTLPSTRNTTTIERRTADPFRTTYHRDGTVTLWSVYRQQWERQHVDDLSDETLATLRPAERDRIARMQAKAKGVR